MIIRAASARDRKTGGLSEILRQAQNDYFGRLASGSGIAEHFDGTGDGEGMAVALEAFDFVQGLG